MTVHTETLKCGCVYSTSGVDRCASHAREMAEADARWIADHIAANPTTQYTAAFRARAVYVSNLGAAEGLV